ncbi:MAG: dihydroorotate dehydrogenase electron transfer subunit [Clostridiales bacterium]|nr:dihydroorotate dehydrogenase electron transfer subunit [Clostridiales bacterium]
MEKKIETVKILENKCIAEDVWKMALAYPFDAKPGQFVNVYLNNKDKLLPRPISVCRKEGDILTLVYGVVGKGTEELSSYEKGCKIRVSTPLGKGFYIDQLESGKSAILIGGGIGIPPLLELCHALVEKGLKVEAVLGFRKQPFLIDDFPCKVHLATDEGTVGFHGNVLDLIKTKGLNSDCYFACGHKAMLKAVSEYLPDVQVSIEERMGCGYGACLGCVCKIKETDEITRKKVCQDGPVFWGRDVVWDE